MYQVDRTPPKLHKFKCLDLTDSPSSPFVDETDHHSTHTTQVELIIANTGERMKDLSSDAPTLTSWNEFGKFIETRLNLQTIPLIINCDGYAPHRTSSCLQQFKQCNRFYVIIPEVIDDELLRDFEKNNSLENEIVESCKLQLDSMETFLKYIEIIQQKYSVKLEEIHQKIDECKNITFDNISDLIVDSKFGGKPLIEYFKEPEKNLHLFNQKIRPKYEELKQMINQKFSSVDIKKDNDIASWRRNITEEFYRFCNYIVKFSVSFSNLNEMVDRYYPRIKGLASLDKTYELTILELSQRNKFKTLLSTTLDEINNFIKEENERRNSFISMITEQSNFSLTNISTIIPCVEQTVSHVNKSFFTTPDISLSEERVNELSKKHSSSYQKFNIKYTDIDDSMESSDFSFIKTFSFFGSTKYSKEMTELLQKNSELGTKLTEIQSQHLEFEQKIDNLKLELDNVNKEKNSLDERIEEIMKENQELKTLLEEERKLLTHEKLSNSHLVSNTTEKELELEIYKKNIQVVSEDALREKAELNKKLESIESVSQLRKEQISSLMFEISNLEAKQKVVTEELENSKKDALSQKELLEGKIESVKKVSVEEKEQLNQKYSKLETELQELKKEFENTMTKEREQSLSNEKELCNKVLPHLAFLIELIDQLQTCYLQVEGCMDLGQSHQRFVNAYNELGLIRELADEKLNQMKQITSATSFSDLKDICDVGELVNGLLNRWEDVTKILNPRKKPTQ